jgi:3-phosphoshikimate 1-carboxyvinyltransferase
MLHIPRITEPVRRSWQVPGSKSITNRALLLAALGEGTSVLDNVLDSDDTRRMRVGLEALGVSVRDGAPGQLLVEGGRSRLRVPSVPIEVGNSGTTVRFLAAAAMLVPGPVTFVGDEAMAKRPIADLIEGLRQLGVAVDCPTGCPPLTVYGGHLAGGSINLRGDKSSQYLTALLLVAGLAEQPLDITIQGTLVSRPYVEMTRRMVADFGGLIEETRGGFRARRCAAYRGRGYRVEPDASSASYPFALAACGHDITVPDLGTRSLQGDHGFVDLLRHMGATVEAGAVITRVVGVGELAGIDCDMHHISDTVMTLAAIAPLAEGPTTIRNVANIRLKECDRLQATVCELHRLGQEVEHGDDWLRIIPRPITPATVECYHDHRIAMSFAVLGAMTGQVGIADPDCVAKTYPGFWDDLRTCYGSTAWPRHH